MAEPNLTSVDDRGHVPGITDVSVHGVRMLTRRSVKNLDDEGRRVAVLTTSTPGLYVAYDRSPCDCDVDCGHPDDIWWSVVTECGFAVTDYLTKDRALGLAVALADVSVNWTADRHEMLDIRGAKGDAWMAAGLLVEAARVPSWEPAVVLP